jgi:hypothetical protein
MKLQYSIPNESFLNNPTYTYDYIDSVEGELLDNEITLNKAVNAFFHSTPAWVEKLLMLRHQIVKHIGLKIGSNEFDKDNNNLKEGDKIGFFNVYKVLDNEVVMGEDDSHLDFRCSLLISRGANTKLSITTVVSYNNRLGRIYFFLVKVFHKLIVKVMMKNMLKKLNNKCQ